MFALALLGRVAAAVVAHEPDVDGGLEIELTNVLQHLALELYRQAPNRRDAAGGDQRSGDPGRG